MTQSQGGPPGLHLLIQLSRGDGVASRYLSSFGAVRVVGTSSVNVAEVTRRTLVHSASSAAAATNAWKMWN